MLHHRWSTNKHGLFRTVSGPLPHLPDEWQRQRAICCQRMHIKLLMRRLPLVVLAEGVERVVSALCDSGARGN
jgi:hypothetical protein